MTNKDYSDICDILIELQNEFIDEEEKLMKVSKEHSIKIDELDQQINVCRNNEDIDFRVFSPRNISVDVSEKISALENEKASLEKEKSVADNQISYYSGKSDRLGKAIFLIKKNAEIDDEYSVYKKSPNSKNTSDEEYDPFSLFKDLDEENSEENDDSVVFDNEANNSEESVNESDVVTDSNDNSSEKDINKSGIPVDEIKRVCHKIEFTERIVNNDRVRAHLELKEIITNLNELLKAYE